MAINPNPALKARHLFACGTTGSGKSSFLRKLRQLDEFKRKIYWDPDGDHQAFHIQGQRAFAREVERAIRSGDRFRLAYVPKKANPQEFEFFCSVLWAALDGNNETAAIVEELADVTGSGKARGTWGELSRKARKYGGVLFSVSQRPAEIDKTIFSQSAYKWCGQLETDAERKYLAPVLSVPIEELEQMPANSSTACHYLLKYPGPGAAVRGVFNPTGPKISL